MDNFKKYFREMQKETSRIAREHGFEDILGNTLYVPTKLALIASEVSEALEVHRQGLDKELNHELADIVIRTMDLAETLRIDLAEAIVKKHEINKNRTFKHGNKRY